MAELLSDDEISEQLPDGWDREGDEIVLNCTDCGRETKRFS